MLRSIMLALTLTLLCLGAPVGARAGAPVRVAGVERADVTQLGVHLELRVARAAYPRNSLVRVWASLRNTTDHRISFLDTRQPTPGSYTLQPEVFSSGGRPLRVSLAAYFAGPSHVPFPISLRPEALFSEPEDIVLRGPNLRVDAQVVVLRAGSLVARAVLIHTPMIHLHLLPADPPRVSIEQGANGPALRIETPSGMHGRPRGLVCRLWGDQLRRGVGLASDPRRGPAGVFSAPFLAGVGWSARALGGRRALSGRS